MCSRSFFFLCRVAFFMEPDFSLYTPNKAEPAWKSWSIDISPSEPGHKWPKNLIGAFDYQTPQGYTEGYKWWSRSTTGKTNCMPWTPKGNSKLDQFVTSTNAVEEHKVCYGTVKVPNFLKAGKYRVRYHWYNYEKFKN